jgi:ketosteroid isomerase-like protein
MERLMNDDFLFTSPVDHRIGKSEFFQRCWPTGKNIASFEIERMMDDSDDVFVTYRCVPTDRAAFRNSEYIHTRDHGISAVNVYFGGELEPSNQSTAVAAIRKLIEDRAEGVRRGDASLADRGTSPDQVLFDIVGPLMRSGQAEARRRTAEWLAQFESPIQFGYLNPRIVAQGGIAWVYSLAHVHGTTQDGPTIDMFWRWTACLANDGTEWKIAHEHNSVPFDPGTGKASLDLTPA